SPSNFRRGGGRVRQASRPAGSAAGFDPQAPARNARKSRFALPGRRPAGRREGWPVRRDPGGKLRRQERKARLRSEAALQSEQLKTPPWEARNPRLDREMGLAYLRLMAPRTILIAPDPRLKAVSQAISVVDADVRRLADDLLESMYAADGIG